jgi:HEAT repeat protein
VKTASNAIKQINDKSAITYLQTMKNDNNPFIRESVIDLLGYFGDENVIEIAVEALQDVNDHVRNSAVKALQQIGHASEAEPALMQALNDRSPYIRESALSALNALKIRKAQNRIIEIAEQDYNPFVRAVACVVLANWEYPYPLEDFMIQMGEGNSGMRQKLALSIASNITLETIYYLLSLIDDGEQEIRTAIFEIFKNLYKTFTLDTILSVYQASAYLHNQSQYVDEWHEILISTFSNIEVDVNSWIHHDNPLIRASVVSSLASLTVEEVPTELVLNMLNDVNDTVRIATLKVLRKFKDERAYQFILTLLNDPNPQIRILSAQILGRGAYLPAVEIISQYISDNTLPNDVREQFMISLFEIAPEMLLDLAFLPIETTEESNTLSTIGSYPDLVLLVNSALYQRQFPLWRALWERAINESNLTNNTSLVDDMAMLAVTNNLSRMKYSEAVEKEWQAILNHADILSENTLRQVLSVGLTYLRHIKMKRWTKLWETIVDKLTLTENNQDLWHRLLQLGMLWLHSNRENSIWHLIFMNYVTHFELLTPDLKSNIIQLGLEWMINHPKEKVFPYLWRDFIKYEVTLEEDNLLTYINLGIKWVDKNSTHTNTPHILQELIALCPKGVQLDKKLDEVIYNTCITWMQSEKTHPAWAYVWQALNKNLISDPQRSIVFDEYTISWLSNNTSQRTFSYVLDDFLTQIVNIPTRLSDDKLANLLNISDIWLKQNSEHNLKSQIERNIEVIRSKLTG